MGSSLARVINPTSLRDAIEVFFKTNHKTGAKVAKAVFSNGVMKDETKRLIGLLWASKGHMIVGGVVGIAGIAFAMRGAYWEGAHAMLAGLGRIDPEKTKEIVAEMECKD